jgi:hypothetical protein
MIGINPKNCNSTLSYSASSLISWALSIISDDETIIKLKDTESSLKRICLILFLLLFEKLKNFLVRNFFLTLFKIFSFSEIILQHLFKWEK